MSENLEAVVCHLRSPPYLPNRRISGVSAVSSNRTASFGSRMSSVSLRSTFSDNNLPGNGAFSFCERTKPGVIRAHAEVQEHESAAEEATIKWWERDLGATLRDVHSADELRDVITCAHGKLVVVEYFATWCGSCRALYPKLCKLAAEHKDIVFVKVNFDESKAFCRTQNVKVLPYFHFYRGTTEQLDSFSCSIVKLQKLKDALTRYNIPNSMPSNDSQNNTHTLRSS